MVNYIGAECYKAFRRKYPYLFVGSFLAILAVTFCMLRVESLREVGGAIQPTVGVGDLAGILCMSLSSGLYFLLMASDIVFSDQYKYNTLKNEVSFGLPRMGIYMGKLIASILTAVVICLVLVGGFLGLGFVLFPGGEGLGESLKTLGLCLLMALPLWLGGLGFFIMLEFSLKGSSTPTIVYILVVSILGSGFLNLVAVFLPAVKPLNDLVTTISLTTPFNLMRTQGPEQVMGYAWALGAGWFALSTAVGLVTFSKREIS